MSEGWHEVVLIDLPAFGKPTRLHWHKRRWRCDDPDCAMGSWTEQDPRIAAPRMAMTDRAGRWVTAQVGRCARSVAEVAKELGCDWHTVNDAVVRYGEALVEHPGRFGDVSALGLDEVLFVRRGRYRRQEFATSIADVRAGQLLDVVPGRRSSGPAQWLYDQGLEFYAGIEWATLNWATTPHVGQPTGRAHFSTCKWTTGPLVSTPSTDTSGSPTSISNTFFGSVSRSAGNLRAHGIAGRWQRDHRGSRTLVTPSESEVPYMRYLPA